MMRINVEWPVTGVSVELGRNHNRDNPIAFDIMTGQFVSGDDADGKQVVLFYWSGEVAMLVNHSEYFACLLGDISIPLNTLLRLYDGCMLQAGHYKLTCVFNKQNEIEKEAILTTALSDAQISNSFLLNKENVVLPGFSGFKRIQSLQSSNEKNEKKDIIRDLWGEYNKYVLLAEQGRDYTRDSKKKNILNKEDFFINLNEKVKDKTLTSCILGVDNLGGLFLKEIESDVLNDELFSDEIERDKDILVLLADNDPQENHMEVLPDIILQDFFKISLDSSYE